MDKLKEKQILTWYNKRADSFFNLARLIRNFVGGRFFMFDWLLGKKNKQCLGIDLGSSAIKIAEIRKENGRLNLSNYAISRIKNGSPDLNSLSENNLALVIKSLVEEAGFSAKEVNVSLPIDKTFSTVMNLPILSDKELAAAIPYEAHKYVPVPLNEVILDWTVIKKGSVTSENGKKNMESGGIPQPQDQSTQVFLIAVSKETINRLSRAISLAGLKILVFEHEAFSLARSLVGADQGTYLIANIGSSGADAIIADGGIVKASHSLESDNQEQIFMELDRIVSLFQMKYNKKVSQCLISGGKANSKEMIDFLSSKLKFPVKAGNPLARVAYPSGLENRIKEIAPQMSVAVGLAMRE